MKGDMRLIYSTITVLILFCGTVSAAQDEDPIAAKKAKKNIAAIAKNADSDNDNILDTEDECPNIPGPASTKGCPDSDGDGIPDHLDGCPTVAGFAQFKGCPDSDLDGIPDHLDVCPYQAGPASNNGCPLSSKDAETYVPKETRVIDTINLDDERDQQIMRYERYVAEQEFKRQEYIAQIANSNKAGDGGAGETQTTGERKTIVANNNNKNNIVTENKENDKIVEELVKEEIAVVNTPAPANPLITLSTVKIENALYVSHKPKLEALVKNMRFQDGRVRFFDENKFFDALAALASYCNTYPEWILTFRCYSNETDNAYGNKQLFSNRVHVLKQILTDDLQISAQRLHFVNSISHASEVSNFVSLEISVK
jgi:hypothetical protein